MRAPARTDKFMWAIEHNIPVVTKEWLEKCVEQSCKVAYCEFTITDRKRAARRVSAADSVPQHEVNAEKLPLGDKFKRKREEPALEKENNRGKRRRSPTGEVRSPNRDKGKISEQSKRAADQQDRSSSTDTRTGRPLTGCIVCVSSYVKVRAYRPE
jgi:hypothetical protein